MHNMNDISLTKTKTKRVVIYHPQINQESGVGWFCVSVFTEISKCKTHIYNQSNRLLHSVNRQLGKQTNSLFQDFSRSCLGNGCAFPRSLGVVTTLS